MAAVTRGEAFGGTVAQLADVVLLVHVDNFGFAHRGLIVGYLCVPDHNDTVVLMHQVRRLPSGRAREKEFGQRLGKGLQSSRDAHD